MPLGTLEQNRRIDLRPYTSVWNRLLYVSRPSAEKMWIPLGSLPSSEGPSNSAESEVRSGTGGTSYGEGDVIQLLDNA